MRPVLAFLLAALALLLAAPPAVAQTERRVALVVGNSEYVRAPLVNPRNDAAAVAAILSDLGFEVLDALDLGHARWLDLVKEFGRRIEGAEVALFYYAGHAVQVDGRNYMIPVDNPMLDREHLERTLALDVIQARLENQQRTNVIILDSCRDNPFDVDLAGPSPTRSVGERGGSGLAIVEARAAETYIAFATAPGSVALDGDGRHSPFTEALIEHMATPGLRVGEMMERVRRDVFERTGRRQTPWEQSSLMRPFYLNPVGVAATVETDDEAWRAALAGGKPEQFAGYLRRFPEGAHVRAAQERLDALAAAAASGGPAGGATRDELDQAAFRLLARVQPVARVRTGGFTYGGSRVSTDCGRHLAERVGAALGGTVVLAGAGEPSASRGAGDRPLDRPEDEDTWLLEGRYEPRGEALELEFELKGRRDEVGSGPVRFVPPFGSPCRGERAPDALPLAEDAAAEGQLRLEMASPRGSNPSYLLRQPPEEVELRLRASAPAYLYCFNRDARGRIQKLLPNAAWPEARIEGGRVLLLPADLGGPRRQRWRATELGIEIVKCFASERPLRLPPRLADVSRLPAEIPGLDERGLLRAMRAAGGGRPLAEASVVLAVLPE